mgnify:CR=1 FL=1
MTGKMFPFISSTWNPLGGKCRFDCSYCWAKNLINRYKFAKYTISEMYVGTQINMKFKDGETVFVQDMNDISFCKPEVFKLLSDAISKQPKVDFLLLTKNPAWYLSVEDMITPNMILGATIETDDYLVLQGVSKAPNPFDRLINMAQLRDKHPEYRLFVSVEPIMRFFKHFGPLELEPLGLWGVAVGYDNYHNGLDEPTLAETEALIKGLEDAGVKVYRKTIREAKQ